MKKSKAVALVLVTGILACRQQPRPDPRSPHNRLYMRTDTTRNAPYSRSSYSYWGGNIGTRNTGYTVFRPYGSYNYSSGYKRGGYESSGISRSSNSGSSSIRGGFGSSGGRVSSS